MQNSENYKNYKKSGELVEYLKNNFGFTEDFFNNVNFYTLENGNIVYMLNNELKYSEKITQIGLPVFKGEFPRGYVTNTFIYRFGKLASKNVIEVKEESILSLVNREGVKVLEASNSKGHHIVKSGNKILGRGWVRDGLLYLDAPKIWRQNLLDN